MASDPGWTGVAPVRTRLAWLLGASDRERTAVPRPARLLGRFPPGWHLFDDIPVGERGATVDHVLVGPGGVFTVDAKDLGGAVVVVTPQSLLHDGRRTAHLRRAVTEASRASRRLSRAVGRPVEVFPVLAILADDWTIAGTPTDVLVGAPRGVKDSLLRRPAVLRPAEVVAISAAAAEPTTWASSRRQIAAST